MKQLIMFALFSFNALQMEAQEKKIFIGPDKVSAIGVAPMQYLQYRYDEHQPWQILYGGIEGFKHQTGYQYTLLIQEEAISNPPADGSSIKRSLIKILDEQQATTGQSATIDGHWILDEIRIEGQLETVSQLQYSVEIKGDKLFAKFCNSIRTTIAFGKEREFKAGPLMSTKMICPQMAYENAFATAMQQANAYKITPSGWALLKGDTVLALFIKEADAGQSLDKKTFNVVTLYDSTGAKDMRATKAFMRFDLAENRVAGKGGCNNYFGSVNIELAGQQRGAIQFSKIGSTLMACPQYMDLEQKFYQLLEQVDTFEIHGNQLRLMNNGTLLIELESPK